MKKIVIILFFIPFLSFSQYFIPFGEDSIYRTSGWYSEVYAIYPDYSNLYIGGYGCERAGNGLVINDIVYWDNNNWNTLDNGMGGVSRVYVIKKYQNQIYIGGNFNDIDNIPNTENIGRFNGTTWEALPNSYGCPNSYINDMVVWDNKLIIGGWFNAIPTGSNLPYIAAYDGNDYIDINDGEVPFNVMGLAVYNNELYACGVWSSLKKYIGNKHWEQVGGSFDYNGRVLQVDTFNNFLYVAGGFQIVDDSIPCDGVAFWDGYKWTGVGTGEGDANDLQNFTIYRGELYSSRVLDTVAGVYTGKLAKWNGTNWEPGVPGGIKFQVNALAVYNDELWIGGGAPNDGVNVCQMDTARKTLARWHLPPTVNCNYLQPRIQSHTDTFFVNQAVQIHNNNAYVDSWTWNFGDGGTAATQNPYHTYTDTGTYTVSLEVNWQTCNKTIQRTFVVVEDTSTQIKNTKNIEQGFKVYPNPTKNFLFVELKGESKKLKSETVQIIDINGKTVKQLKITNSKFKIQIEDLKKGTYFVKIGNQTQRFVKE